MVGFVTVFDVFDVAWRMWTTETSLHSAILKGKQHHMAYTIIIFVPDSVLPLCLSPPPEATPPPTIRRPRRPETPED